MIVNFGTAIIGKKRDIAVNERLTKEGWTVLRFWGRDIKEKTIQCADIIEKTIKQKELQ